MELEEWKKKYRPVLSEILTKDGKVMPTPLSAVKYAWYVVREQKAKWDDGAYTYWFSVTNHPKVNDMVIGYAYTAIPPPEKPCRVWLAHMVSSIVSH